MNNISCVQCGLKNWLEDGVCKRCGHPLAFIEAVRESSDGDAVDAVELVSVTGSLLPPDEWRTCSFCSARGAGVICRVCRKPFAPVAKDFAPREPSQIARFFSSANGWVTVMIILALLATGAAYGVSRKRASDAMAVREKVTNAISQSPAFSSPVYISFAEASKELSPGVRVLTEKGLLIYRLGTTPRIVYYNETDKDTGEIVRREKEDPTGGQPYAHVELTERGRAESANWMRLAGSGQNSSGWSVPLGSCELIEINGLRAPRTLKQDEYQKLPADVRQAISPNEELVLMSFTWRWKPNDLGHHFDVNSDDHLALSQAAQESARQFRYNDSSKVHPGRAALVYRKGQPEARAIWFEDEPKK